MLRLVAYAPDGVRRFPIRRPELTIGSQPQCDICLPYTGVAQRHARLLYDGEELRIEDLGSRRGVLVAGKKVKNASLELLDEVRVGSVMLLVEDAAAALPTPPDRSREEPPKREPRLTPEAMLEHLGRISDWVLADVESRTPMERLVGEMLTDFGGGALFLFHGELETDPGIKFVTASEPEWLAASEDLLSQVGERREAEMQTDEPGFVGTLGGEECWISGCQFTAVERSYVLLMALPEFDGTPEGWSPGSSLRMLGDLLVLGLVHHLGTYEPILPGRPVQKEMTLDPGLVVGESPVMRDALDQLRQAIDADINLLLRGEAGSGREMLARSLHLSSPLRNGPFVTASCSGASPAAVEADLFGAEVPGKGGPVRREGKLLLADGGTLFLRDIEELPLDLQARLVRFLRSGEVEPAGSLKALPARVRLVVASRRPLAPRVARDLFRIDLAHLLSRFAIDVPAVRERRDDLPLLIQASINRACHETGKRMQGVTVKAMSALLAYDWPGNLTEIENIARQMVYLCPPGRPIEVNVLPERVRLAKVRAPGRVETGSELDLDRLVADTERAAIREALRRTQGNKSQAARLLNLSRNGLAMKMQRHGLAT